MRMRVRLRDLHGETGGQISFLMVVGAVALTILLGWLGSTGHQVASKVEAQAAADAAALSGGAWVARGLNITSAINVMQSQLAAGAILLSSLDQALRHSQIYVTAQCTAFTLCSPFSPFCVVARIITCAQRGILQGVIRVIRPVSRALAKCPGGLFWKLAKGLEYVNWAVHSSFAVIAAVEVFRMARLNKAYGALLLPGRFLMKGEFQDLVTLPTHRHDFRWFCDPMEEGSPAERPWQRGYSPLLRYPEGQGPLALGRCRLSRALLLITGIPPLGPLFLRQSVKGWMAGLCGQDPPGPVRYTLPAKSLEDCAQKNGRAEWAAYEVRTRRLSQPLSDPKSWLLEQLPKFDVDVKDVKSGKVSPSELEGYDSREPFEGNPDIAVARRTDGGHSKKKSCADYPKKRLQRRDAEKHGMFVESGPDETSNENGYQYEFKVRILKSTEVETEQSFAADCAEDPELPECSVLAGRCAKDLPNPYLLRSESPLPYLVLAARKNQRAWFSERWQETPPPFVTYTQVEVYSGINPSGEGDAFIQDWRVRLQRATLLDSAFEWTGSWSTAATLERRIITVAEWLAQVGSLGVTVSDFNADLFPILDAGFADTSPYLPPGLPPEDEVSPDEPAWRAILNH